jgi:glyoxylase-like metal-dependent hydrolase (beta-lactamase superfamily II)
VSTPIKAVNVVSTGSVAIHPEHVEGTRAPLFWWLLTSKRWTAPRPINVYVIEHEQGLVLFDTGQDQASVTNSDYFPKGVIGWLYGRLAKFAISPDETLTASLQRIGYDITDVKLAVLSHLHQDHIGGLRKLTNAEIIVSQAEWQTLQQHDAVLQGLMRNHVDLPNLNWRYIDFEAQSGEQVDGFTSSVDIFEDGSLVLLPTPGHTPGSMSLLVRREGKAPLVMVGDLTYDVELMKQGRVPGVGKKQGLQQATKTVNALRDTYPGLVVLPAHDPGAADRLNVVEGQK